MRVDLATGSAEVVIAWHPPPYLLRNGTITALDVPPNVPLGMFEGSQYVECPAQFRPGDRLVLVSDGLVEATDPVGEEYGEKRLQGALLATAALSTAEAVRHIIRTTRDYQHDELRDDATVPCLDWWGSAGGDLSMAAAPPAMLSPRAYQLAGNARVLNIGVRRAGVRRGRRSGRRCDTPAEVERR